MILICEWWIPFWWNLFDAKFIEPTGMRRRMNVINPILNVFKICIHKTGVKISSVEHILFLSNMNYKKIISLTTRHWGCEYELEDWQLFGAHPTSNRTWHGMPSPISVKHSTIPAIDQTCKKRDDSKSVPKKNSTQHSIKMPRNGVKRLELT